MPINSIIERLIELSEPGYTNKMAHFGIDHEKALGIRVPKIRSLAKDLGRNHEIALQLWEVDIHEAKTLAIFLADWRKVTLELMDRWVKDFKSWDMVDQACSSLFVKTPFAMEKAMEWSFREPEFEKRAGFVLMCMVAVHRKKMPDDELLPFLARIEEECCDRRNFVKKALNWLLRQMGKRSLYLNPHAVACGERLLKKDCATAQWIANDALKEMLSETIQKRLIDKEAKKK